MSAWRYRIFGLIVESDFALEEADPAGPGLAALKIRAGVLDYAMADAAGFRDYRKIDAGDLLSFRGVGRFLVAGPHEIIVDLDPLFDLRLVGLPLLGPVIAVLLHRRGHFVMHASAVLMGDQACVFLGDKGAGKSTSAAALVAAGHTLISDDIVAIQEDPDGRLIIHAGYPAMKLDQFMFERFDPRSAYRMAPRRGQFTAGKLRVRLCGEPQPARPLPLGQVLQLQRGSETVVRPLDHAQCLNALLRFAYLPRLGHVAFDKHEAGNLFRRATQLTPRIQACQLVVKHDLEELRQLADILQDRDPAVA